MVVRLRIRIMEMCMDYDRRNMFLIACDNSKDAFIWMFVKLPPAQKMFFSFKRLKVRNWVSQEDLDRLKS